MVAFAKRVFHARGVQAMLVLFDLLILAALLLLPAVWLLNPLKVGFGFVRLALPWPWMPALALLLLLVARCLIAGIFRRRESTPAALFERLWFKRLLVALASAYGFVALGEGVLTLANFKAELPPPVVIVSKAKDGTLAENMTLPDPELIYRLKPGSRFAGRVVNTLGFLGREVAAVKPPGTIRVICMGDSVTAQGRPGYAQYLHERLTARPPTPARWEVFSMGIHAYTSLQGLKLFQKQGRGLRPDIVTLYFGWNDHWLSDRSDRQQMSLPMGPRTARVFDALRRKRMFQFLAWSLNPFLHMARLGEAPQRLDYRTKADVFHGRVYRVEPKEYRAVMTDFVAEIRRADAVPLLITAPRSSISSEYEFIREIRSVEEGNRIHDAYVEITRDVARRTQAPLLDLAALLKGPENLHLFARDGVHFDLYSQEPALESDVAPARQPGLNRVADELDKTIRAIVQSPEWRKRPELPRGVVLPAGGI
ncbi:MAG: SGNH/GDSL hydrolase family protein [Kiritimatiellaeota bacterium]|nr:SGNH/GDSL hydrolase family protein [Kiritimatiellota bacterium]